VLTQERPRPDCEEGGVGGFFYVLAAVKCTVSRILPIIFVDFLFKNTFYIFLTVLLSLNEQQYSP